MAEKKIPKKDFDRFVEVTKDMAARGNSVELYLSGLKRSLEKAGVSSDVIEAIKRKAEPEIKAWEERKANRGKNTGKRGQGVKSSGRFAPIDYEEIESIRPIMKNSEMAKERNRKRKKPVYRTHDEINDIKGKAVEFERLKKEGKTAGLALKKKLGRRP